jgi:alkylation response protein AidB-like acyl-CoA dehydrogenase
MSDYVAPLNDIAFALTAQAGLDDLARLPGFEAAEADLVRALLEEAGKLAGGVLAPTNRAGDHEGVALENGVVRLATGFDTAYRAYVEGGWNGLSFDPAFGGQGLPWTLSLAVQEMFEAANLAFSVGTLLTRGAIELLSRHGSPEQKALYLPDMIAGTWSGTMNLTEPQAGTDLARIGTRAERAGDGTYRIAGQKIFITYGEHELTGNIVHLVLARLPVAPDGVKGISLFIVPKYLLKEDGTPGARNDLRCVSVERKLGIHGSPTCVMAYGDDGGATGFLVGEENRGLEYMFTMMNNARVAVGVQGLGIAERAYQQALAYARERVQGRRGGRDATIVEHPDIRRMLLSMKSRIEAGRALLYVAGAAYDVSRVDPDAATRAAAHARFDLLTPVVKAWCTDNGVDIASMGVQIHGGMGFIEETGAAQHYRDARILPIYEGTNAIQALDLVGRKIVRDGGQAAGELTAEMTASAEAARDAGLARFAQALADGLDHLRHATDWLLATAPGDNDLALASATSYLALFGTVAGGWQMTRQALAARTMLQAGDGSRDFLEAKRATARFYMDQEMPKAAALAAIVTQGGDAVSQAPDAAFA